MEIERGEYFVSWVKFGDNGSINIGNHHIATIKKGRDLIEYCVEQVTSDIQGKVTVLSINKV